MLTSAPTRHACLPHAVPEHGAHAVGARVISNHAVAITACCVRACRYVPAVLPTLSLHEEPMPKPLADYLVLLSDMHNGGDHRVLKVSLEPRAFIRRPGLGAWRANYGGVRARCWDRHARSEGPHGAGRKPKNAVFFLFCRVAKRAATKAPTTSCARTS